MKRFSLLVLVAVGLAIGGVSSARAADPNARSWIFRPSYYSHDPVMNVQIGPRFDGGPYFVHPQGTYVRSGYYQTQSQTPTAGGGTNLNNSYESWFQIGAQW